MAKKRRKMTSTPKVVAPTTKKNTVEILPTRPQLQAIVNFLQRTVNDKGEARFVYRDLLQDPEVSAVLKTPSYVGPMFTYFMNEGYVERLRLAKKGEPSVWNVTKLITHHRELNTREDIGAYRKERAKASAKTQEVAAPTAQAQTVETPAQTHTEAPVASESATVNEDAVRELKQAIETMTQHLTSLPQEMGGHLNSISDKLSATVDTEAVDKLQKQVDQLTHDKQTLEDQLSTARAAITALEDTNKQNSHQIYRKGATILELVDRMIEIPAWAFKQNGPKMRNQIKADLDYILNQAGLEEEKKQEQLN